MVGEDYLTDSSSFFFFRFAIKICTMKHRSSGSLSLKSLHLTGMYVNILGRGAADWIQGYTYSLGRQGLRVSNSPVSS